MMMKRALAIYRGRDIFLKSAHKQQERRCMDGRCNESNSGWDIDGGDCSDES